MESNEYRATESEDGQRFSWTRFRRHAAKVVQAWQSQDVDLASILARPRPPNKSVDEYGRPLPDSVLANEHPDPSNFERVLRVRSELARDERNEAYAAYASRLLVFFRKYGPFSDANPLFVVQIATRKDEYEFLFSPSSGRIVGSKVRNIGKVREGQA